MATIDVSGLMPTTVSVKAGETVFEVSTDLSPSLFARISRWMASYDASFRAGGPDVDEDEFWSCVALAMGVTVDVAKTLGFTGAVSVLAFLVKPLRDQAPITN